MKILVHYPFDNAQVEAMRQLAQRCGDHTLYFAKEQEQAIGLAGEIEALLGHFPPALCAAAPNLKWIQSFSAGMNNFLFDAKVEGGYNCQILRIAFIPACVSFPVRRAVSPGPGNAPRHQRP